MKVLVLDEADQLLEDSFARDLRRLTKVNGWPKVFFFIFFSDFLF